MTIQKTQVCIIGGGFSGLYLATKLQKKYNICIIEKRAKCGGRVNTKYDKNANVMYECGPWRINTKHKRLLKIVQQMKLKTSVISSDSDNCLKKIIKRYDDSSVNLSQQYNQPIQSLSHFQNTLLTSNDVLFAEYQDVKTGYCGIHDSAQSTNPYQSDGRFLVLHDGFQKIIDNFEQVINSHQNSTLLVNTMAINIRKTLHNTYIIDCQHNLSIHAQSIILACPPIFWTSWQIYTYLKPLHMCVKPLSLNHIYAKTSRRAKVRSNLNFHIKTTSALSQIISSSYQNNWFQISYSAGKVADFWFQMNLRNPTYTEQLLKKYLQEVLNDLKCPQTIHIKDIVQCYVRHAFHLWLPNFNFDKTRAIKKSICPNPARLPMCFVSGEAFSSHQGWIEGALETSDLVLRALHKNRLVTVNAVNFEYVIFQGAVLNIQQWKLVHPGSTKLIQNHIGQDITTLFKKIHTSEVWGLLFCLQKYWTVNKETKFYDYVF
jgi:cytochrome b involved in lipid metabolism